MKTLIVLILILTLGCKENDNRYYLVQNDGRLYKMDKKTGQTWVKKKDLFVPIDEKKESVEKEKTIIKTKEEKKNKALQLAKNAQTFFPVNQMDPYQYRCDKCKTEIVEINVFKIVHTNERCIKLYLRNLNSHIEILGWNVQEFKNGNYLVEYNYKLDGVLKTHALEVNPELSRVRPINNLEMKMIYYEYINKYVEKIYPFVSDIGTYEEFVEFYSSFLEEKAVLAIWNKRIKDYEDITYEEYLKNIGYHINND